MKLKPDYTLYLVTDRNLMTSESVEASVEQAILGGVTVVQLRENDISSREFYETALRVKAITKRYDVPLIINNRADIAVAIDADGVHVGQKDLPYSEVRRIVGPDMLVGVSAHNVGEALAAAEAGVDYLGAGAVFPTDTKAITSPISTDELMRIRTAVNIPIVAIGGINKSTLPHLKGTGIDGIAVISAIVAQKDLQAAARELKALFESVIKT
jgi:thiamine-phosphate pyrophosphorylase